MQLRRWSVPFVFLVGTAVAMPAPVAAQSGSQRVSLEQFRQLRWLSGEWRGSGGAYASFFEEYRVVNDSTIAMRAFSDSTFQVATDSSMIEWRNGVVRRRSPRSASAAVDLTDGSVRFLREGASTGGFTFTRLSNDQWTATLHPSSTGGAETVYVMRRARQ